MLTLGSLFSGVGGIELGFERTGRFKTIWNCEIEPYPSAVLEKNFPGVKNYGDITKVDWSRVERPDVLVGGFPCQDISVAGRGAGIKEGTRSGLWSEYARAIRELRPRYVVVENVPMLARRGLTRVLGDIAALGYDAEWFTIRASDVGAPHRRERLFIIAHRGVDAAHADNDGASGQAGTEERWGGLQAEPYDDADAPDNGHNPAEASRKSGAVFGAGDNSCEQEGARWAQGDNLGDRRGGVWFKEFAVCADAPDSREKRVHGLWQGQVRRFPEFSWCEDIREVKDLFNRPDIPEPLVRGTNDGLPKGLDGFVRRERTKALGNAVVPAVAEVVAWRVLELEAKL